MLTEKTEALGAKVEPMDKQGITVFGGAIRTSEGLVVPSADARKAEQAAKTEHKSAEAPAQVAPAAVKAPVVEPPVQVTYSFTVNGTPFEVPAFYKSAHIGTGCVVLALNEMSYTPNVYKQGDPLFSISVSPNKKYAYTGMAFERDGVKNIILIEG